MSPAEDNCQLALITGASSGIGLALARQFADHGYALVIAAEDERIRTVARELHAGGAEVTAVQVDLTRPEAVEKLWFEVSGLHRPLAVAALNAGVGIGGRFVDKPLERQLEVVDLNVRSTVHLAKLVTDQMVGQGSGRIMITSSIAGTAPGPYHATYAASKAFGHSFAEALRKELKGTGVTVTSLQPGPTDTDFFRRAEMEDAAFARGPKASPEKVAEEAFNAVLDGKPHLSPGLRNRLTAELASHLPDRFSAPAMGSQAKPRSTDDPG